MIDLEHRRMYGSNGLIYDFALYGDASGYTSFAVSVRAAIGSGRPETLPTSSGVWIEITNDPNQADLFTSLQNEEDFYPTMAAWEDRNILRVRGSTDVLESLCAFLLDLPRRGAGYSCLSEYSDTLSYAADSPKWRLHVRVAFHCVPRAACVWSSRART
ncbi:hypothetical protein [Lysobacter sp. HA35]